MNNKKVLLHKSLYKSPRGDGLPWKDVYRQRCFQRIRSSRDGFLEKFRTSSDSSKSLFLSSKEEVEKFSSPGKTVQDIMEEEWSVIHKNRSFPSLIKNQNLLDFSFDQDDWDDEARELKDIQNELFSEEEAFANEFLNFDAAAFQSQIAMFEDTEVICPVCKTKKLYEIDDTLNLALNNNSYQTPPKVSIADKCRVPTLKCDCGVKLSGKGISLCTVQSSLQRTINAHEENCSADLTFTALKDFDRTNILIYCSLCEWRSTLL